LADDFHDVFDDLLAGTAQVRTRTGGGAYGDQFAPTQEVADLMVEYVDRLVTTPTGGTVQSTSRLLMHPASAGPFTYGSEVTLPNGRVAKVVGVDSFDVYGLPNTATVYLT